VQELQIKTETAIEAQAETSLMGLLKKYERSFNNVLPKALTAERWRWLIVNNIRAVPALAGCTPVSFLNSVLLAANVGLEIRKNSAYLIPYGKECQLIIDYRGKMELARRAGVGEISCELVREADEFEWSFGIDGRRFNHVPALFRRDGGMLVPVADRGDIVAGYAAARLPHGLQVEVMLRKDIDRIRGRARGADSPRSPWNTDYEQMARKTIIHRICNYLPQSPQLVTAQEIDDAEATGHAQPLAPEIAAVAYEIDPADNLPMVNGGGDSFDEQRETLKLVGEKELAKAGRSK
jgi:recombination protein RecT